jgi:hypothetical protein
MDETKADQLNTPEQTPDLDQDGYRIMTHPIPGTNPKVHKGRMGQDGLLIAENPSNGEIESAWVLPPDCREIFLGQNGNGDPFTGLYLVYKPDQIQPIEFTINPRYQTQGNDLLKSGGYRRIATDNPQHLVGVKRIEPPSESPEISSQ